MRLAADALKATSIYDQGLPPTAANHRPQSPLSLLEGCETAYPDKTAIIHGRHSWSWKEYGERCRRLASALGAAGIGPGDTVSALLPNTPPMLECHFAVPMLGAVLNTINTRLDAATIAYILEHCEAKALIVDRELSGTALAAIKTLKAPSAKPLLICCDDELAQGGDMVGDREYEDFIAGGDSGFSWSLPEDDWQAISLNYTSGTTGRPKGVVSHHRGAYLSALANAFVFGLDRDSIYLWTLPMFHVNGWSYTWAVAAACASHLCLRRVDPAMIFTLIKERGATHMCGAPVVLNTLIHAPAEQKKSFGHTVRVATGGAAPPAAVVEAMEALGFSLVHLYGLTETYGPALQCAPKREWESLPAAERAVLLARQGVPYPTLTGCGIFNADTLERLPADGESIGELMLRGNTIMKGYLKNPEATAEAFAGGWFRTGDLGVMHPDGYVEIKDRAKDIIISGGENISSLEVEACLYRHPAVMEAAVVAMPHEHWGETPCAFVALREGREEQPESELIEWCREHIARFKAPSKVIYGPLPKTSTGKIQKHLLRAHIRAL